MNTNMEETVKNLFNNIFDNAISEFYIIINESNLSYNLITDFLIKIEYPNFSYIKNCFPNVAYSELFEMIKKIINSNEFISNYRGLYDTNEDNDKLDSFLKIVISSMNNNLLEPKKEKNKHKFACIPLGTNSTVLENDLEGRNSTVCLSSFQKQFKSPNNHNFFENNMKQQAQKFLKYLDKIEKFLSNEYKSYPLSSDTQTCLYNLKKLKIGKEDYGLNITNDNFYMQDQDVKSIIYNFLGK